MGEWLALATVVTKNGCSGLLKVINLYHALIIHNNNKTEEKAFFPRCYNGNSLFVLRLC